MKKRAWHLAVRLIILACILAFVLTIARVLWKG